MSEKQKKKWFIMLMFLNVLSLQGCLHTKGPIEHQAGDNLGFELLKDGLPVNWIFYTPPSSEYRIWCDTLLFTEGKQSLRFDLYRINENDRVNYTGFTNEFQSLSHGGGKFRLSFKAMNQGTRHEIYINGVKEKESGKHPIHRNSTEEFPQWKTFVEEIEIPKDMWLRFEIKLYGKGTFRIDEVKIKRLHEHQMNR